MVDVIRCYCGLSTIFFVEVGPSRPTTTDHSTAEERLRQIPPKFAENTHKTTSRLRQHPTWKRTLACMPAEAAAPSRSTPSAGGGREAGRSGRGRTATPCHAPARAAAAAP